jgi:hypothetical protein
MPPAYVKPYVKRGKSDAADAVVNVRYLEWPPSPRTPDLGPGCVNVWPAPSARVLVSSVDQSTPTYPVSGRTLAKMEIRTSWSS